MKLFVATIFFALALGVTSAVDPIGNNGFLRGLQQQQDDDICTEQTVSFLHKDVPPQQTRSLTNTCPVGEILLSYECSAGGGDEFGKEKCVTGEFRVVFWGPSQFPTFFGNTTRDQL